MTARPENARAGPGQEPAAHETVHDVPGPGSGPAPPPSPGAWPRGTETVLLAEDEPMVRTLIELVLQQLGYTVLPTSDGEQAAQVCAGHPWPVHLLLSDVALPGMTGPQLARRVRELRPGVRVLFLSGFLHDIALPGGGGPFLAKPFTPEALVRKVREVLDAASAAP